MEFGKNTWILVLLVYRSEFERFSSMIIGACTFNWSCNALENLHVFIEFPAYFWTLMYLSFKTYFKLNLFYNFFCEGNVYFFPLYSITHHSCLIKKQSIWVRLVRISIHFSYLILIANFETHNQLFIWVFLFSIFSLLMSILPHL